MRILLATVCLSLGCVAASAQVDEAEIEETVSMVRSFMAAKRDDMIEVELELSAAETEEFWPLYEAYRAEIGVIQDRYGQLIVDFSANYDSLTDAMAERFINDYFAVLTDTNVVRQGYVTRFTEVIPIQKLARLYQMENKIDAIAGLELVLDIPLAEMPVSSPQR